MTSAPFTPPSPDTSGLTAQDTVAVASQTPQRPIIPPPATETANPGAAPRGQHTSAAEVRLSHGEVLKGSWQISRVHRPLGWLEGNLIVTDARVIYRARAKNWFNTSFTNREIQLNEVNGLGVTSIRGLSSAGVLMVTGLLLLGVILLVTAPLLFIVDLIAIGAAFALLRSTQLVFTVFSRQTGDSPIALSYGIKNASSNPVVQLFRLLASVPLRILGLLGIMDSETAATDASVDKVAQMYDEIGALILDLQNRGVLAEAGNTEI